MIDTSGGNTIVLFLLGSGALLGLGIWALVNPSGASIGLFILAVIIAAVVAAVNFN